MRMPRRYLIATATTCICTEIASINGFVNNTPPSRNNRIESAAAAEKEDRQQWNHEPFDFSSKLGWDTFYEDGIQATTNDEDIKDTTTEKLEYDWHPHISHSIIVDCIKPTIETASEYYQSTLQNKRMASILLVGCGNSALPRVLHHAFDTAIEVTCLDYSSICIDMIRSMYQEPCPNMRFVVGDATKLQDVQWDDVTTAESIDKQFDVIIDKGLLDALMCGDGFDIEQLMDGTNNALTSQDWGLYVLICFELSKSSKQSLVELGNNDNECRSLIWDFNVPVEGSENGRGCFNVAWRSANNRNANPLGIEQKIITEWI